MGNNTSENERKIKEWFFAYYAFERQRPVPYFKWKAIELLNDNKFWPNNNPNVEGIWKEFHKSAGIKDPEELFKQLGRQRNNCELCKLRVCIRNVNRKNNPLNPKHPIWKISFKEEIIPKLKKNSASDVKDAYDKLKEVSGISNKIAPYFLRDLVLYLGCKYNEKNKDAYYYLQPIDTWVRLVGWKLYLRSIEEELIKKINDIMGGTVSKGDYKRFKRELKKEINQTEGLRNLNLKGVDFWDKVIIKRICDECIDCGVNPLKFNQGAWYVGARVVRCREQFEKILEHKDLERAKELVNAGIIEDHMDKYFPRELIKNECLRNKFVEEIKKIDPQLVES